MYLKTFMALTSKNNVFEYNKINTLVYSTFGRFVTILLVTSPSKWMTIWPQWIRWIREFLHVGVSKVVLWAVWHFLITNTGTNGIRLYVYALPTSGSYSDQEKHDTTLTFFSCRWASQTHPNHNRPPHMMFVWMLLKVGALIQHTGAKTNLLKK